MVFDKHIRYVLWVISSHARCVAKWLVCDVFAKINSLSVSRSAPLVKANEFLVNEQTRRRRKRMYHLIKNTVNFPPLSGNNNCCNRVENMNWPKTKIWHSSECWCPYQVSTIFVDLCLKSYHKSCTLYLTSLLFSMPHILCDENVFLTRDEHNGNNECRLQKPHKTYNYKFRFYFLVWG